MFACIESARVRVRPLSTGGQVDKPLTKVSVEVEVFGRREPNGPTRSILRAHGQVTGVTGFRDVQTDIPSDLVERCLGADKVRIKLIHGSETERVFWVEPHDSKQTLRWPFGVPICHNDRGLITLGVQKGFAADTLGLSGLFPDAVKAPPRPVLSPLM